MKGLFAAVAVLATLVGSSASAFDPAHLKRLMETNECKGCELSNANLLGAKLRGAILVEAILASADLRNAILREANITGANLGGADLTGANLSRAYMNDVILCNTTMPDGSVIYSGC
jgi:uncharacterized protein YjbI with pentapeptide repeats